MPSRRGPDGSRAGIRTERRGPRGSRARRSGIRTEKAPTPRVEGTTVRNPDREGADPEGRGHDGPESNPDREGADPEDRAHDGPDPEVSRLLQVSMRSVHRFANDRDDDPLAEKALRLRLILEDRALG